MGFALKPLPKECPSEEGHRCDSSVVMFYNYPKLKNIFFDLDSIRPDLGLGALISMVIEFLN